MQIQRESLEKELGCLGTEKKCSDVYRNTNYTKQKDNLQGKVAKDANWKEPLPSSKIRFSRMRKMLKEVGQ